MRHGNSNKSNGYLVHNGGDAQRSYSTDGEESHHATSVRTSSEYAIAHKPSSVIKIVVPSQQKSRRSTNERDNVKRVHVSRNGRTGSDLSRDSPPNNNNNSSNNNNNNFSNNNDNNHNNRHNQSNNGSETNIPIFITNSNYRTTSDISRGSRHSPVPSSRIDDRAPSHYSCGSARSGGSTVKTKTSRHGGIIIETMSTPNPFCPNTKGMCCLMLLLNLSLILVTLGFVIVTQIFQPVIVWILGIVFVIFGFLTLLGSMVYCIHVCKNSKNPGEIDPEDFYWTRYWQGHVGSAPEIHYKAEGKYQDDGGSDRSKYSVNYSERRSQRY
ncbi:probable serine/threonine-protein kinase ndrD isoform X1 [Cotesia glomerata]|uniref:Uncharacterized protein n=1 Tax=Cotesia glomerata TaxID=32391 RepID=A0AAV7J708_COTGL|nr:probable serine/threonine-protein kinase ndrD isoform X1 [Cotesia glomerata]KAH0568079.1 hypothetical protein KQX54_018148 [Cotesia glomerata]